MGKKGEKTEWGFWHFQMLGWIAFSVFSFPLKWVILENIPGSVAVSLYRDGLAFLLTLGMRELYRRVYRIQMRPASLIAVVSTVSIVGGAVLTCFSLAFHLALDFQEEKVFAPSVVFAIFYFRTGLCAGWSVLYFAIRFLRDHAQRELLLARLERDRAKAELHLLRTQMDPHFLHNALNTLLAGVGKSDEYLKALIRALSQFLRYSLETRNDELVPLGKECDAVAGYLAVEKARFGEKLEIECHIDRPARDVLVPGILIQPLVENAMKYGRLTSPRPQWIRLVISSLDAGGVRIEVSNTGRWVDPDPGEAVGGIGLKNLRKRLKLLYPESHQLEISCEKGWVSVTLTIFPQQ